LDFHFVGFPKVSVEVDWNETKGNRCGGMLNIVVRTIIVSNVGALGKEDDEKVKKKFGKGHGALEEYVEKSPMGNEIDLLELWMSLL
jgi:hypothetical protein